MEVIRSPLVRKVLSSAKAKAKLRAALRQTSEERKRDPQTVEIDGKRYRLRFGKKLLVK